MKITKNMQTGALAVGAALAVYFLFIKPAQAAAYQPLGPSRPTVIPQLEPVVGLQPPSKGQPTVGAVSAYQLWSEL